MSDWKAYLSRKGITLQDFVDDHRITDVMNLRRSLSKLGFTVPLDNDQNLGNISWYRHNLVNGPDVKVVKISRMVKNE
jgi:hypothetical protein